MNSRNAKPAPTPAVLENRIEQFIRTHINEKPEMKCPGVHALAAHFHTSTARVSAVARRLADAGVIEFRRKTGIVPAATHSIADRPGRFSRTSVDLLCDRIIDGIGRGKYPAGKPMPKTRYLAATEKVSDHTVRDALAVLDSRGIVRRSGRGYVTGTAARTDHGAILCCQISPVWWEATFTHDWFAPFNLSFMRETALSGTEVMPVFWQTGSADYLVHGEEQITRTIRGLGERFMGVLISQSFQEYRFGGGITFDRLVRWFVRFGKPVVWFDALNELGEHKGVEQFEMDAYGRMCGEPRVKELFTRCHHDQEAGVRCAVETLHTLGHRNIFIPVPEGDPESLGAFRIPLIKNVMGGYQGMSAASATVPVPELHNAGTQEERLVNDRQCAGALKKWIRESGATAVIALKDAHARLLYLPLRQAGFAIPRDLSLLSFDNVPRLLFPQQISSVDFGFGSLGYAAYHLIAGDVPIRRSGIDLPAQCSVNHFGSLGRLDKG